MCGISGIFRPKGITNEDIYYSKLSLEKLKSRGPDNSNSLQINDQIIFNHTRLSIIDPDKKNNQPIDSLSKRFSLIYNGEIYNYEELKRNLIERNYDKSYKGIIENCHSDTRILLEHFEKFGIEETLIVLNGMYALSLFDRESGFLYLARDYYGQKPLFYSNESNILSFSSLLTDCKNLSRINININTLNAQHGLQFGMSVFPETLISGIFQLQPGHLMTVCIHDQFSIVKSFKDLRTEIKEYFLKKSSSQEFSKIFSRVIDRHLIADCKVGLLLSGGIDSSLIASFLSRSISGNSINTYTLDFPRSDDSILSSNVSSELKLRHHLIPLIEKEYSSIIERTIFEIDQPAYDPAIFSARYLNKKSRDDNCKVVLTGDGADEIFAGYNKHYKKYFYNSYLPVFLSRLFSNYLDRINQKSLLNRKLNQLFHLFLSNSASESYLNMRSDNPQIYSNSDYIKLVIQEFYCNKTSPELYASIDEKFLLPNKMLFKNDRSSMLESLEARSPYLDMELISISNRIDKYIPKRILKEELNRKLYSYPINKRKEGFKTNFSFLEKTINEIGLSNNLKEINELIGINNNLIKMHISSSQKLEINQKYPYSSWSYIALAKWIDINILK